MTQKHLNTYIYILFIAIAFQICNEVCVCLADTSGHSNNYRDNHSGHLTDKKASVDTLVQVNHCLENQDMAKAWQLLVDYAENDSIELDRRKPLIILQQLSYADFRLNFIKQQYKNNRNDVFALTEYEKLKQHLDRILIDKNELSGIFSELMRQVIQNWEDEVKSIHETRTIRSALSHAKEAFSRSNHAAEADYLRQALRAGAPVEEQLEQCLRFVDGIRYFDHNEYERAIEYLLEIRTNDRHYSIAQEKIDESRNQIFQRDSLKDLHDAWKSLDWDRVSKSVTEPKKNARYEELHPLKREIELSESILFEREAYLQERSDSPIIAIEHLNTIRDILENNSHIDFNEVKKWLDLQRNELIDIISPRLEALSVEVEQAWNLYNEAPILIYESDQLWQTSDFSSLLKKKVINIKTIYGKAKEADRIARLLRGDSNCKNTASIITSIESEVLVKTCEIGSRVYQAKQFTENDKLFTEVLEILLLFPEIPENDRLERVNDRRILVRMSHIKNWLEDGLKK